MTRAASFVDAIRAVSDDLRGDLPSPARLNHAAARLDHLGRRLHGVGWTRDHEIGRCLMAAVSELGRARGVQEADRGAAVAEAIRQLDDALSHAGEGLRPDASVPATEHAPGAPGHDEG